MLLPPLLLPTHYPPIPSARLTPEAGPAARPAGACPAATCRLPRLLGAKAAPACLPPALAPPAHPSCAVAVAAAAAAAAVKAAAVLALLHLRVHPHAAAAVKAAGVLARRALPPTTMTHAPLLLAATRPSRMLPHALVPVGRCGRRLAVVGRRPLGAPLIVAVPAAPASASVGPAATPPPLAAPHCCGPAPAVASPVAIVVAVPPGQDGGATAVAHAVAVAAVACMPVGAASRACRVPGVRWGRPSGGRPGKGPAVQCVAAPH